MARQSTASTGAMEAQAAPESTTAVTLDELDMSAPLEAREGVNINYLLRARIHYLAEQNRALLQQVQFADAKAALLCTLMGLLVVNVANRQAALDVISVLFLLLTAACFGAALWAVSPRYPNHKFRNHIAERDRFLWPALVADDIDRENYATFMRDSQASQLVMSIARSNVALSNILMRKFVALRVSFALAAAATGMWLLRFLISF